MAKRKLNIVLKFRYMKHTMLYATVRRGKRRENSSIITGDNKEIEKGRYAAARFLTMAPGYQCG